ncbi:hypothetical protein cyc_04335 [Cyclospora cayetanensis]|uniref:Uncharacterized protein n=1 Tax=Cyclospora cayetanensis TaxID=88456 RepID=A0A1D3CRE5_9EIME|nr:hypothetical protein cyc_04335 [Cyclospora cayetanensis]
MGAHSLPGSPSPYASLVPPTGSSPRSEGPLCAPPMGTPSGFFDFDFTKRRGVLRLSSCPAAGCEGATGVPWETHPASGPYPECPLCAGSEEGRLSSPATHMSRYHHRVPVGGGLPLWKRRTERRALSSKRAETLVCPSSPRLGPLPPPDLLAGKAEGEIELLPELKNALDDTARPWAHSFSAAPRRDTSPVCQEKPPMRGLSKQLIDALERCDTT